MGAVPTDRDLRGALALVRRPVHPELAGLVGGIVGFDQRGPAPVPRRQAAGSLVPLVISLDGAVDVRRDGGTGPPITVGSFVAGLSDVPVSTVATASHRCVQAYLTPIGIRQVLGVDGRDLAGRVVDLAALAPELCGPALDQLRSAPDWPTRLGLVESALRRRVRAGRPVDDVVAGTWQALASSGGRVAIADVVRGSGWSHRHLSSRFRTQVGLTPKVAAGIVRFERATADLISTPLAEVAVRHGYADQSHLTRDVVRFSGETPAVLRDARRPTAHTALGTAP
ncbi:AraC family transcriptional regulator [Dermatobacter hominis]|uniref:AraC family transcriptional regulator n=1 Tax=Dermatobacter hominis TaxID=2884263 RepID=UPI001D10EACB|nr:helix-turn-helix domain-containing protein [Dermatobacter hominis]UDY34402.1 helix-turn-helix domain-containing protein [Dermatobacter hominis]